MYCTAREGATSGSAATGVAKVHPHMYIARGRPRLDEIIGAPLPFFNDGGEGGSEVAFPSSMHPSLDDDEDDDDVKKKKGATKSTTSAAMGRRRRRRRSGAVFACGPDGLVRAARDAAVAKGYSFDCELFHR